MILIGSGFLLEKFKNRKGLPKAKMVWACCVPCSVCVCKVLCQIGNLESCVYIFENHSLDYVGRDYTSSYFVFSSWIAGNVDDCPVRSVYVHTF